jgi:hypothetical protein
MITGTTLNRDLPQNGATGHGNGSVLKASSPQVSRNQVSRLTFHVSSTPVSRTQVLSELRSLGEESALHKKGKKGAERRSRYELARAVRGLELRLGRRLSFDERVTALNAWYEKSKAFTKMDYDRQLALFMKELKTVKKPIGGDVAFLRMVQTVAELPVSELPWIEPFPDGGPESFRRAAALHREKAKQAKGGVYELSCRDLANAVRWDHREAHALNEALAEAGVIAKAENGAAGKRKGVATKWRYLLPLNGDVGASQNEEDDCPF